MTTVDYLSALNVGSGLNTTEIIDALVEAERAPVAGEIIKLVAPQLNIPIQNSFDAFQEHVRADIQ